ncbi:hypothetical protein [Virgibacillus sp. DJP39]|uniref:hypothetical protein n=1 Tax=Virgibacillus sp. DJP39 TaxID=3409790 RepID=UPI003BB4FDDB
MLSTILWGAFLLVFITLIIFLDKRKKKNSYHKPYQEKTDKEKEVEIAIAKEKSRRGSGIGGGF